MPELNATWTEAAAAGFFALLGWLLRRAFVKIETKAEREDLCALVKQIAEQNKEARESRRLMYAKLEQMTVAITRLQERHDVHGTR